jgi:hypothetical protein
MTMMTTTWQSEGRSLGCDDSRLRGPIRGASGAARGPIRERYGGGSAALALAADGALLEAAGCGVSGQTGAA